MCLLYALGVKLTPGFQDTIQGYGSGTLRVEEEMATYSSILPWKNPCPGEPGGLQSMGLQRVRHD